MAAVKLSRGEDSVLDVAIYHTQQCAEKALKGFLAFHLQPIIKTHDLRVLLDKCITMESSLELLKPDIDILNPYSVMYRYPDVEIEPEVEQLLEAIKSCKNVFETVSNLM